LCIYKLKTRVLISSTNWMRMSNLSSKSISKCWSTTCPRTIVIVRLIPWSDEVNIRIVVFKLYALKEGSHQILFHYVGDNCFDVTIFEDTLSENTVVDFFLEIERRSSITYHALVHFTLTLTVSNAQQVIWYFYNQLLLYIY